LRLTPILGEITAILSSLAAAVSAITLAKALNEINPIHSNFIKTLVSSVIMFPIAFITGEMSNIFTIDISIFFLIILSAVIGFGIGDTLLYKSVTLIGVSKSYTIANSSPLFTMIFAVIFLGEQFRTAYLIGTILILASVIIIFSEKYINQRKTSLKNYSYAIITALTWSIGIIIFSFGIRSINILLANALRFSFASFFLFLLSHPNKKWKIDKRNLILLSVSGITGLLLGNWLFSLSILIVGASKATSLSASSPVWTALMSHMILKEKVTYRLLLSSINVVIGIYFLSID
jgi:DME family drug/metabolite transporter